MRCPPDARHGHARMRRLMVVTAAAVLLWMTTSIVLVQGQPEEMHIPASLVVRYSPPVSAAVSKNHKIEVQFHAQLNISRLLDTDDLSLDYQHIPMWIRCPGRLTAVAEPTRLLEISSDAVDVIPMDFVTGVNTVLVLCGKELGHVRLVLYWELTNASLCFELFEDYDEEEAETTTTTKAVTVPEVIANTDKFRDTSTTTTTTATGWTPWSGTVRPGTAQVNRTTVLNKTFVVVRGPRRNRRSAHKTTNKCEVNCTSGQSDDASKVVIDNGYYVHVLLERNGLEEVLTTMTVIVAAIAAFFIGFKVELDAVKSILRKPAGLVIGFACQLLLMPLISYGLAVAVFQDDKHSQLGLTALGTSPTSVLSNAWVLMMSKSVNLGISTTAVSQICAFFIMPLWLKLLSHTMLPNASVNVPWNSLFWASATVFVPLSVGIFLSRLKTSWAQAAAKVDRTTTVILMVILNCTAIATLWSMVSQTNWTVAFAELALVGLGYTSCWTLAYLCRQDRISVATVSIVTAMRNADVARNLLQLNVQKPDSDLSSVQLHVHILVTNTLVFVVSAVCDTVHRRRHTKCTDLPPTTAADAKDVAVAEPLILRAVFISDTIGKADTSYLANEPLTSDIMNQASNVTTAKVQEPVSTTTTNDAKSLTTFGK